MKITIIGTSNSLVKDGFKDGFNHLDGLSVTNISIGGCSAIQHVERMLSHQNLLFESDVVILDSIVNDLVFSMSDATDITFIMESITAMYQMAASMNKPVLSVLFPTKHHLGAISENGIYEHHISECKRLSIAVIDLFSICRGMQYKELGFLDGPHISPFFARSVGEAIGRYCLNSNNFSNFNKHDYLPINKHVGNYRYSVRSLIVGADECEESVTKEKSNSQFSEKLVNINNPKFIALDNVELLGILQWSDKNSLDIELKYVANSSESNLVKLKSSDGLLRFTPPYKPLEIHSQFSIGMHVDSGIRDSGCSTNGNIYIKNILVRSAIYKTDVDANDESLPDNFEYSGRAMDVTLLDLQIRKQFSMFMLGIKFSLNKMENLKNKLDDDSKDVVGLFLKGLNANGES